MIHFLPRGSHSIIIAFTIITSVFMIIDSILVSIYLSIPKVPSPQHNIVFYIVFLMGFIVCNYFLLRYVQLGSPSTEKKYMQRIPYLNKLMFLYQGIISLILLYIASQLIFFEQYPLVSLLLVVYLTFLATIIFLGLLVFRFINWFLLSKSYFLAAYAIAFALIVVTIIITFVYLSLQLTYPGEIIYLGSIKAVFGNYSNYGADLSDIGMLHTLMSIISFLSIWIPSVILLKTYSLRIGRLLYWTLVSIPVVMFLLPNILDESGLLDGLFLEYGKNFTLLYYIIFSPYKQIGGLLFGIVFWVAARRIQRGYLKILINTAGIGIVLLFGASVLHGLTYVVAPPFGLITISYLSLASFLLMVGILNSARELSIDNEIRKEIYKIAEVELALLRNISMADLVKRSEQIVKKAKSKVELSEKPLESRDESDYKKFVEEIMEELYSKKVINDTG